MVVVTLSIEITSAKEAGALVASVAAPYAALKFLHCVHGVLIWFEVYEGKEPMAKKPFCDRDPKSIALTLRMLKPFFGSVGACAALC